MLSQWLARLDDARGYLVLAGVMLVAASLRFWGFSFGLPHGHCRPDVNLLVYHALSMGAGDLNPHVFYWPTLHFYLLAFVFRAYFFALFRRVVRDGIAIYENEQSTALLEFAASTKYNLGLFAITVLLAGFHGTGSLPQIARRLLTATSFMTIAFIAVSPYIVPYFTTFWRDFTDLRSLIHDGRRIDLGNGW